VSFPKHESYGRSHDSGRSHPAARRIQNENRVVTITFLVAMGKKYRVTPSV